MADITAPLKHPTQAGLSPTPKVPHTAWNEALGYADGLAADGYVVTYDDGSPNANLKLSNNGARWLNAPLRASLTASSAAVAWTTTASPFNKSVTLLAGAANVVGHVIVIEAGGRVSSRTAAPGSLTFGITLGSQTLLDAGTQGATLVAAMNGASANYRWALRIAATVRTAGTSGTVQPGAAWVQFPATVPLVCRPTPLVTLNLTIANAATVHVLGDTPDVQNTATLDTLDLWVAPPGVVAS